MNPRRLIFGICLIITTGCGRSSLDTVPVMGMVTYQGKPLIGGTVSFHPVDGAKGRPARAIIEQGKFSAETLQNVQGVVPGEYLVSVLYIERPLYEVAPRKTGTVEIQIPSRYSVPETSGLKLNVPSDSSSVTYDIKLVD